VRGVGALACKSYLRARRLSGRSVSGPRLALSLTLEVAMPPSPLEVSPLALPTTTFEEVALGDLFHFVRGQDRELATFVKIARGHARAQAGGEVVAVSEEALVCVVRL
jgi:hypothetical protein